MVAPSDGEFPEHLPQRMELPQLRIAVAGDDERRHPGDSAPEEPKDIERGAVRPVHVLEHQDRRASPFKLVHQGRGDVVRQRDLLDESREARRR